MSIVNVGSTMGGLAGGAATARLLVTISGHAGGLQSALTQAGGQIKGFQANANQIGNALIRGVSLPAMAVGGVALKMAADYKSAMARVAGLSTATAAQVQQAYGDLLEMSKKVPTAPVELADSLYFAASAGLEFDVAMQVVEKSAQGAAIGMGRAADLAKVLIFSLNAYEKDLSRFENVQERVNHVMDVFAEAVKRGTAEPDELALALGRVLPVAEQAGVAFETVVGSIASLTNIGLPTRVASTSLRALFAGLMAPTQQAREQLRAVGLEAEDLRRALDAGPLVAFKLLEDATRGNEDQMRRLIPQIRAMTGYLGLTGDRADDAATVFNQVRNSAGSFGRAIRKIEVTPLFQFGIAMNSLRVAGIQMGTKLFPVLTKISNLVSSVAGSFSDLGDGGQAVAAGGIVAAAALGPLVKLYAVLTSNGQGLFSTWKAMGVGLATLAITSVLAYGGLKKMASGQQDVLGTAITLISTFATMRIGLGALQAVIMTGALGSGRFAYALLGLTTVAGPVAIAITAAAAAIAFFISQSGRTARNIRALSDELVALGNTATITMENYEDLGNETQRDIFMELAERAGVAGQALGKNLDLMIREVKAKRQELEAQLAGEGGSALWGSLEVRLIAQAIKAMGVSTEDQLQALAEVEGALKRTGRELEAQTDMKIAMFIDEQAAVSQLAKKYGASEEFIGGKLREMGVGAQELTETSERAWAEQQGIIDSQSGRIVAKLAEQREAEQKLRDDRRKALSSDLLGKFFEKDIESIDASTAQLIANTDKQTDAAVAFAQNVKTLLRRGLDPSALQFLVDQGPAMVGKFVGATDQELKKLETNYSVILGAVDAAILNEGKHQEVKGKKIVSNFSKAILANKNLPKQAQLKIMGLVVGAIEQNKLAPKGAAMVQEFTQGIFSEKGISNKAGTTIALAFAEAVASGDLKGKGVQEIFEFAQGVVASAGLPEQRANEIAQLVAAALRIDTTSLGLNVGLSFAQGLKSAQHAVNESARLLALTAQTALGTVGGGGGGGGTSSGGGRRGGGGGGTGAVANRAVSVPRTVTNVAPRTATASSTETSTQPLVGEINMTTQAEPEDVMTELRWYELTRV